MGKSLGKIDQELQGLICKVIWLIENRLLQNILSCEILALRAINTSVFYLKFEARGRSPRRRYECVVIIRKIVSLMSTSRHKSEENVLYPQFF